jgi:uncharacterized Ntn-hydrolase superfamily protein
MTFSIVAKSADGETWGVATASKFLGVGAVVPAARAGVGAIATQALANTTYKPDGLKMLADGQSAAAVVAALTSADDGRDDRQLGIVDARGGAATFTGMRCLDWAGGLTNEGVAIQGNILVGPEVVGAVQRAWLDFDPARPLSDRLVAALSAGDAAGGDRRGRQSAALLVVREEAGYEHRDDVLADLRVDDHPDPCNELHRLLGIHHILFDPPNPDDLIAIEGEVAAEIAEHIATLAQPDLDAWVGKENYEMRVKDGFIDLHVLDELRKQAGNAGR